MALIALLAAFLPGPALAQTTGACCIPEAACEFESAYQCMRDGGVFLPGAEICICSRPNLGIGMSQTAARRLLRERVVHTLYVERSADVYTDQRYVDLIANGVIIAPTFTYDLRHGPVTDRVVNAEAGAAAILLAVEAARADWNTEHAPPNTLPFHWAIRLDAFGSSYIFQQGPASVLPAFANHPGDVTGDKLTNHEYIYQDGVVASASDYRTFTVTDTTFFGQFDDPYYLLPTAARVKFGDHEAAIEGFDRGTGTFTLVSSFTGTATGSFTISRTDAGTAGLLPCYFFKNGQEDVGEWVTAFCTYMAGNRPAGLSEPVAVIVSAEDFDLSGVDFSNYLDYLNDNEGRDVNSEYLIDANHTLQQWNDEFAVDQDNNPLDFTPEATPFSPLNADVRSYLMNTLQTAYNHARDVSTWQHFRTLWPRAILSQYQLGDSYGVKVAPGDFVEVPRGPGEANYHGVRNWRESVSWDAYYCITNPAHSASFPLGDDRIVPMGYNSASFVRGFANAGSGIWTFPVQSFVNAPTFDPDQFLGMSLRVFIEFTSDGENNGLVVEAASFASGVFTLLSPLTAPTELDDEFIVYYPYAPAYTQYVLNGRLWPLMETFCDLYGQSVDREGFLATSKKWAAECSRAQTRALPKNPYTVYYGPGSTDMETGTGDSYDGVDEYVSRLSTYPDEPFSSKDGWLDGQDWGEVGSQDIDYGVNHFVWFLPKLFTSQGPGRSMTELVIAIGDMNTHYMNNLMIYQQMACIGDWDKDNQVDVDDAMAFSSALSGEARAADLNNDGLFNSADTAIFEAAFCTGNCAPISGTGCTGMEGCDADWCQDEVVGVPDIFCFLADWFANDPTARNYGGVNGVPAIFAFLAVWFATGIGPCPP